MSVLNNPTQTGSPVFWSEWGFTMEPAQDPLSHTTQGRNYTTSMPSRISTALFQDPAPVRGNNAGRESHIPAEGRKPKRGDGWCCRGFQLAPTDIPGLFPGRDNRRATEKLLYNNFQNNALFTHTWLFKGRKLPPSFVSKRAVFCLHAHAESID